MWECSTISLPTVVRAEGRSHTWKGDEIRAFVPIHSSYDLCVYLFFAIFITEAELTYTVLCPFQVYNAAT